MGFRFRKRIKLFPGLWPNAGKRGISASIGGQGLNGQHLQEGRT